MKRTHCVGIMAATLRTSYGWRNADPAVVVEFADKMLALAELAELNRAKPPGVARPRGEMIPYRPGDAV